MEILAKRDGVFESSKSCPGCGSILGLKFILQAVQDTKNTVIVTSPGDIALMGMSGLKTSFINSRDPASTARGLATARPDMNVVVYSGDGFTGMNLPSLLSSRENFLYVCYNNSGYANINVPANTKEFVKLAAGAAVYAATASVAYYEDFAAKLAKAFSKPGLKFIDLLAPCPALWKYDPSNTIEVGRMATESLFWPLYEVDTNVAVTKIPPNVEPFQRYAEMLKMHMSSGDIQAMQDYVNKRWKNLGEGKLL